MCSNSLIEIRGVIYHKDYHQIADGQISLQNTCRSSHQLLRTENCSNSLFSEKFNSIMSLLKPLQSKSAELPANNVNYECVAYESNSKNNDVKNGKPKMYRWSGRIEFQPVTVNIQQVVFLEESFCRPLFHRIDIFEMLDKFGTL